MQPNHTDHSFVTVTVTSRTVPLYRINLFKHRNRTLFFKLSLSAKAALLSDLFTHLDVYLTFIPDIDPHRISNDVTLPVIVVANQTEGWHHIRSYQQVVSD